MFVKRHGRGPDVYFCIHGWSGSHRTFDPLLPFAPETVTVYSADLPGYGNSAPLRKWELASVTNEIVAALDETGASSVTLVGNCLGALLALRAAAERQRVISRVVLIDAFARWPWYFRVFTFEGWGKYAYATTFANPIGRWITNRALASRRTSESDLTQGFVEQQHDVQLQYLQVVREIESVGEFAGLSMSVDIVFGSRTFGAVRDSARAWVDMWPHARVTEIPHAGHLVLQEAADVVSELIFRGGACRAESAVTLSSMHR
jgi:pimeloyl-ACP methyl ester carboxylesterase